MFETNTVSKTTTEYQLDTDLGLWVEAFLVDRKAGNRSPGTLTFYHAKLQAFQAYCDSLAISKIDQITPSHLREWLIALESAGHNSGGIHAYYRTVRTFLIWFEDEAELPGWKNPIRKVKAPRVEQELLEPADIGAVNAILETCRGKGFTNLRDRAVILTLLDTGMRASELTALDVDDFDQIRGSLLIRQGKGRKPRIVFVGKTTRKALRAHLLPRGGDTELFTTDDGQRLAYEGLRQMIRRRALRAGVAMPTIHSFRRYFALSCLRAGMDIYSLQRLMGHSDLQILRRYLAQTDGDLETAHTAYGPVDRL